MTVFHDKGLSDPVMKYLKSVGHKLKEKDASSVVQGIAIEGDDGNIITGNNDFRKAGAVDGF